MHENEFRTVKAFGEILCRPFIEFLYALAVAAAVGVVGKGIERILYLPAVAGVVLKIGVADDGCHGIVWIGCAQPFLVLSGKGAQALGFGGIPLQPFALAPTAIEEEHVVACFVETVEVGELPFQAPEGFCGKSEVLKLVLLHDGSFEE